MGTEIRVILVTEQADYSQQAMGSYKKIGPIVSLIDCDLAETRASVEGIVCRLSHYIGQEFVRGFPSLKWVASPTTGLTHIDTEFLKTQGIRVFSLRNTMAHISRVTSTSELALGLALAVVRGMDRAIGDVRSGRWERDSFIGRQLSSMDVGILGFGRLGKQLAGVLEPLGSKTRYFDNAMVEPAFNAAPVALIDLFRSSELLFITIPGDAGLVVTAEILSQMNRGSYLVNVSRGEVIDEEAVFQLLSAGILAGYATDVLKGEQESGFLARSRIAAAQRIGRNVIITPHIGGATTDAMRATEAILAEHVLTELNVG